MNWATFRTPVALLLASSVITGAAVMANDDAAAVFTTSRVGAWLPSDSAGSVSHAGPTGVDATVELTDPQGRIEIVEIDGEVFVVDESGRRSRLDLATLEVVTEHQGEAGGRLAGGGDRLYAIDGRAGTVQEIDTMTLRPKGILVELDGPVGDGLVDEDGVLWLAREQAGEVVAIDGSRIRDAHPVAAPGTAIDVAITEAGPVAIDSTTSVATVIEAGGGLRRFELPFPDGAWLQAADRTNGAAVLAVVGGGIVVLLDPRSGQVERIALDVADHRLGSPRTTATRLFVPDLTAGTVHMIDLADTADVIAVALPGEPHSFELIVDDHVAYVNDRGSEQVWLVDTNGQVDQTVKYDTADGPGDRAGQVEIDAEAGPHDSSRRSDSTDEEAEVDAADSDPPSEGPSSPGQLVIGSPPASDASSSGETNESSADEQADSSTTTTTSTPPPDPDPVLGTPGNLRAVPGNRQVTVRWDRPAEGEPIRFEISVTPGDGGRGESKTVRGDRTSVNIRSLRNGTSYTVEVVAVHAGDALGPAATVHGVVPIGRPSPPRQVRGSATDTGDGITLQWVEPADTGGSAVQRYEVSGFAVDGTTVADAVSVEAEEVLIGSLTPGESYTFQVVAITGAGRSDPASSSEIATSQPAADQPASDGSSSDDGQPPSDGSSTTTVTSSETTIAPTSTVTTLAPTPTATNVASTSAVTTAASTSAVTTLAPTSAVTTVASTSAVTTVAPTSAVTTLAPTTTTTTTGLPLTRPSPPGPVPNVRITSRMETVLVAWDPAPGATLYRYRYNDGLWSTIIGTTSASPMVDPPLPQTGTFSVRAANAGGDGPITTIDYVILTPRGGPGGPRTQIQ